ncbi:MAG TPA: hypothetical protein VGP11_03940 [Acidimicrobiales bacterium]|nr:hypothetical protein [Acidimicrobiales bacterium]
MLISSFAADFRTVHGRIVKYPLVGSSPCAHPNISLAFAESRLR